MERIKSYTIAILIGFVGIILILQKCNSSGIPNSAVQTTIYKDGKTDTIVQVKEKPIYIRSQGKIQWLKEVVYADTNSSHIDTLRPFISSIDTIISNDTLKVSYAYPLNEFELSLKKRDSILYINTVDTLQTIKTETIEKSPPFWHYMLTGLLGIVTGAIINR